MILHVLETHIEEPLSFYTYLLKKQRVFDDTNRITVDKNENPCFFAKSGGKKYKKTPRISIFYDKSFKRKRVFSKSIRLDVLIYLLYVRISNSIQYFFSVSIRTK